MKISINEICFKTTHLKFQPGLPGAYELTYLSSATNKTSSSNQLNGIS